MKAIVLALLAVLAPGDALVATPDPIEGIYSIVGVDTAGNRYSGAATIRKVNQVYVVTYATARPVQGIGVLVKNHLSVSWRIGEEALGSSHYEIDLSVPKTPVLRGTYAVSPGDGSIGSETLTKIAPLPATPPRKDPDA